LSRERKMRRIEGLDADGNIGLTTGGKTTLFGY